MGRNSSPKKLRDAVDHELLQDPIKWLKNTEKTKPFISAEHAAAEQSGRHSPGPQYDPEKINNHNRSKSPEHTFGRSERSSLLTKARFISKQHAEASFGSETPMGPQYDAGVNGPSPHSPSFSFGKATRTVSENAAKPYIGGDFEQDGAGRASPGPKYELPPENLTKSIQPAFSFGSQDRFEEKNSSKNPAMISLGPGAHTPSDFLTRPRGATHVFGSAERSVLSPDGHGPEISRYISSEHSAAERGGIDSPGPGYGAVDPSISKLAKSPAYSFGLSDRPPGPAARASTAPASLSPAEATKGMFRPRFISSEHVVDQKGMHSPGPAAHHVTPVEAWKNKNPAYSFPSRGSAPGVQFLGADLAKASQGMHSPAPNVYTPDDSLTVPKAPQHSIAKYERSKLVTDARYISGEHAATIPNFESPPPGTYDPNNWQPFGISAPQYTMVGKEVLANPKISPSPEHPRFLSAEASRENMGSCSPGPKYVVNADMFGQKPKAPSYSLSASDREFTNIGKGGLSKLNTPVKPYGSPAEARFQSKEMAESTLRGRGSPGPVVHNSPNMKRMSDKTAPSYSFSGAEPSKEFADRGQSPPRTRHISALHADAENRGVFSPGSAKYRVSTSAVEKKAPNATFISSPQRPPKLDGPGLSSPGPLYSPNFSKIQPKAPASSFGGL